MCLFNTLIYNLSEDTGSILSIQIRPIGLQVSAI